MLKICFWMNMPSHHQRDFFDALISHPEIDVEIRYYEGVSQDRKELGWNEKVILSENEQYVNSESWLAVNSIKDWKNRIHIVPGFSSPFLKNLLEILISNNVSWIHWSERSGRQLAEKLRFNKSLINIFYPIFLRLKGYIKYALQINQYALGAFAQGEMAKIDFTNWGVRPDKIEYLFYSLNPLFKKSETKINEKNKKKFCYIGALSKRKGTDILIKAFSVLKKSNSCELLLVGKDSSNGKYQKLCTSIGISNLVTFIDSVPFDKINAILNNIDIFVLPSRFDGWGVVLNEAASLAKPLISTNQCGAAFHLIENNINGYRIEAGNVEALRAAMQTYIDKPYLINEHGKKSLELFNFITPEKNVNRLIKAIKKWQEIDAHYN